MLSTLIDYGYVKKGWYTNVASKMIGKNPELLDELIKYTNFLDAESTILMRLFCVVNNITEKPTCYCGNQLGITRRKLRKYCCRDCKESCPTLKQQTKDTCVQKYGVEYATQAESTIAKKKSTFITKYGVDVAAKAQVVKDKAASNNMAKYGVKSTAQVPEFIEKRKQTNLDRYGLVNATQNPDSINKRIRTNIARYGSATPLGSDIVRAKIKQTNIDRYGYPNNTCRHITQHNMVLSHDKDWLTEQHHTHKLSQTQIAHQLGVDPSIISARFKLYNIPVKHYFTSIGEQQICELLDMHKISYIQSDRSTIAPYELDILIPDHNLAIEYCGLYWHSDIHDRIDRNYHERKYQACKEQGIQLITVFEDEWVNRTPQVTNKIMNLCGIGNHCRVYARKCNIIEVPNNIKRSFFNDNHIQGNGPGSITYGLEIDGSVVACMTFIKQAGNQYCLNRYATSKQVPGGFSKLLTHFERNNDWDTIVSFADLRWSDGGLYHTNGFTLDSILRPDYSYSPDGRTREHKFNYRHANLPNKLDQYDPELSETQNCDNNGILRIWDCGKLRFIKRNQNTTIPHS